MSESNQITHLHDCRVRLVGAALAARARSRPRVAKATPTSASISGRLDLLGRLDRFNRLPILELDASTAARAVNL
jgi:hypothetical protein